MPEEGLTVLITLEIIANSLQFLIFGLTIKNQKEIPRINFKSCNILMTKELFRYGTKSATMMLASRLQSLSIPLIISKSLGVEIIVYYSIPNRLSEYAKSFAITIGSPLTPYFAEASCKDDQNKAVISSWLLTSFLLQVFTMFMTMTLAFCGKPFLSLWIGDSFAQKSQIVVYILVGGLAFEAVAPNTKQLLMAKNKHGGAALVWLLTAIMSIPLAIAGAMIKGVTGAIFGAVAATALTSVATLSIACKVLSTSLEEYFKQTLVPLIPPIILTSLSFYYSINFLHLYNYTNLLLLILLNGSIYIYSVWRFSLTQEMRVTARNSLNNQIKSLRTSLLH